MPPTDGPGVEKLTRILLAAKPQLCSILRRNDIPPSEAEHLLYDTFLRFLQHRGTVSDPADWLADVLQWACTQYQRQYADSSQEHAALAAQRASWYTNQERRDPAQILDRALGALQGRCREAVLDPDPAAAACTKRLPFRIARILLRARRWFAALLHRRPKRRRTSP